MTLQTLSQAWLDAKSAEKTAIDQRRKAEDNLLSLLGTAENLDGTETHSPDGYKIKITGRITHRVDGDRLQEIAEVNGLADHLPVLFRWKPEINLTIWKSTSENITNVLSEAITAKPGRPSISITTE